MSHWMPSDWAIFLAALAAAISSIVSAFQNKGLKQQQTDNHAETMAKVDDNHAETLAAVQTAPLK